jgi:hypothetical protein
MFIPNDRQLVLLTAVGRFQSCVVNEPWHVTPTNEHFLPEIRIETFRYNRWLKQMLLQTCTRKLKLLVNYVVLMCIFFRVQS